MDSWFCFVLKIRRQIKSQGFFVFFFFLRYIYYLKTWCSFDVRWPSHVWKLILQYSVLEQQHRQKQQNVLKPQTALE